MPDETTGKPPTVQIILCRNGESLRIDEKVLITISGISGTQVKLGLKGPADVMFYRQEVYQRADTGEKKDQEKGHPATEPDPPR